MKTNFQEIFTYLNASKVIKIFGVHLKVSTFKQLIRGYDSNGKPADFSEAQKQELFEILEKFANKILEFIKKNKNEN